MHCLTERSQHAHVTIHLCYFARPVSFADLSIQAFQQTSLVNVCISCCNNGHNFHMGESHAHTVVWECCKDDQQSQREMLKFDPQLPLNPLSDHHQIWHAWLRHWYLSPRKNWAQSVKGFLLPIYAKYTPPYATLYICLLLFLVLPITYSRILTLKA